MTKEDILNIISSTSSNEEIAEAIYQISKNPICIEDENYHILCYFPHTKTVDSVFNQAMEVGHWSMETVSYINKALDKSVPHQIINLNNRRRMKFNLIFNSVHLGYATILEQDVPLEEIDIDSIQMFMNFLARELYVLKPHEYTVTEDQLLLDLLEGNYVSRKIFLDHLKHTALNVETRYRMVVISLKEYERSKIDSLDSLLENYIPHVVSIVKDNNVIMLTESLESKEHAEEIERLFFKRKLKGIISTPILDLYHTKEKYQLILHLLNYLSEFLNEYYLYDENDYKHLLYLVENNDKKMLWNYVDNEILDLYYYDTRKGTTLCETLLYYLIYDEKLQQAAKNLYLHKNTVTYRLDKAKEVMNYDLSRPMKNHSLVNSLLMVRYLTEQKIDLH